MPAIKRLITVDIILTPQEIAQQFCKLHNDQQAEFFNEIAAITKTWKFPFTFQLQAITDSAHLNDDGRRIMALIGEYSSKS